MNKDLEFRCLVLLLLVTFVGIPAPVLSQHARNVKGKKYQGYIFPDTNDAFIGITDQSSKFTPDQSDVDGFERNLSESIGTLFGNVGELDDNCPDIRRKLKRYTRQYFGFINTEGEKILYINFIWSKSARSIGKDIDREFIRVHDGCSFYWQVKYNIGKKEFYDLMTNSSS